MYEKDELEYCNSENVLLHELGNIVMLMNFSINKIEKDYENIENNKYFKNLKEDAKQIVYLINSSKEKIYSVEKRKTDIEKLLYEIINKYRERCAKSRINLEFIVEKKTDRVQVDIDEFKMTRVFENIIINSIEELEMCSIEEKKIRICLFVRCRYNEDMENDNIEFEEAEGLTVSINNNGRVIPKEKIKEIFKPYITSKENGNGIGLAFCEKIIKLHGGSISVKSNKEEGTSFIIKC